MAANVLNSSRAIDVSVFVVRAFVRLREMAVVNQEVARRLDELDRKAAGHDKAIRSLVQTIRQLMAPADKGRRSIGFRVEEGRPPYGKPRRVGVGRKTKLSRPDPRRFGVRIIRKQRPLSLGWGAEESNGATEKRRVSERANA